MDHVSNLLVTVKQANLLTKVLRTVQNMKHRMNGFVIGVVPECFSPQHPAWFLVGYDQFQAVQTRMVD